MSRQDGFYASPDGRVVGVQSTMGVLFSDDFGGAAIDSTKWQVIDGGQGAVTLGSGAAQAAIGSGTTGITDSVSGSALVVAMGTTNGAERWYLSTQTFAGSEDLLVLITKSQANANNSIWIGLVEVDPQSGFPLLNPNLANDFTNRGGVEFGKTGTATLYNVEAVADSSGSVASSSTNSPGTAAQSFATAGGTEVWVEFESADIIASSQIPDSISGKAAGVARVSTQCPNDGKAYKLLMRFRNVGVPTATTVTIGRVLMKDGQEFRAEISSGRGDTIAQKALAVNVTGTADNVLPPNPSLLGAFMTTFVGGSAVGTSGNIGRLIADISRRLIVRPFGGPQSHAVGKASQTLATTTTAILAAAGATIRYEIQNVTIANRDNIAHTIDLMDAAAVVYTAIVPAGTSFSIDFPNCYALAALNTAFNFQIREGATTAVEVSASAYKTTA